MTAATATQTVHTDTFSILPNRIARMDISMGAKVCYARLNQYAGKRGRAFPKVVTLAAEIGASERQTRRYIVELKERGLIRVRRRGLGRSNVYRLADYKPPTDADRPHTSHQDTPDTSGSSLRDHGEDKRTAAAVVPSVDDYRSLIDAIPDTQRTRGVRMVIKQGLVKYGKKRVERSIGYTVANIRDTRKLRAYLDRAIRGDWGIDWRPQAESTARPKEVTVQTLWMAEQVLETHGEAQFKTFCDQHGITGADVERIQARWGVSKRP